MSTLQADNCMEIINYFDDPAVNSSYDDNSDKYFARIIGCIEDIIMNDEFQKLHNNFMDEYWQEFDDDEENKLAYIDIFKKYINVIEKYIDEELQKVIDNFNMIDFEKELTKRQNELDGEIFEMLLTFSDFEEFKSKFLEYKAMKEGKAIDFSEDISIFKYNISQTDVSY